LVGLWLGLSVLPVWAGARTSVLVLHSYHPAPWTDALMQGIESVLGDRPGVDLYVEYMDSKKADTPAYEDLLHRQYLVKYGQTAFSVVLLTDNNALSFSVGPYGDVWRGAPLVFCGVNDFHPDLLVGRTDVTGVIERGDFAETLRFARRVRPNAAEAFVISDTTETAQSNLADFFDAVTNTMPHMPVSVLRDLTAGQLESRLRRVSPDAIVFFISFWRDADGADVSPDRLGGIFRACPAPVFGRSEWMIGKGLTGGKCVSGFRQGEAAARLAARILAGEAAAALPVDTRSPNQFMFDYTELARHHIPLAALPDGASVVNRPEPFFRVSCTLFYVLLVSLALATVLVTLLAVSIRRRHRAVRALRASEEDLRITLQSIGDGVIATGADGKVRFLNPVAEELTGWRAVEAIGRSVEDVVHLIDANTRQPMSNPVARVLGQASAVTISGDVALIDRDGSQRRIADSAAPIRNAKGALVGAVLVFRDVTDHVRLEGQLRQAQRMDSIGQLASGVAHDFNNMLAGVLGAADLLAPLLAGNREGSELLNVVISAAEQARQLTAKLLACSRRGQLPSAPIDVHRVIRDSIGLLTRSIDRRIEIRADLDAQWHVLNGVASQIESLFLNLGVNARDAMPDGGQFSIRTANEQIGADDPLVACLGLQPCEHLRIEIADTGVGMTREVLSHVFEPFFTTKTSGHGTGLGLASVYGAVKDHGGNIQIWSEPGQGTQFTIRLPVTHVLPLPVEAPVAGPTLVPGCVLVVDDEPLVRSVAEAMLEGLGCAVLTAVDGVQAVELFEQHHTRIAAVLLDLIMPRMDGRATFHACRRIDPNVPVILSSGYSSSEILDELLRDGARGVLPKPYRRDELIQALASVMGHRAPAAPPAAPP
jgi:PAS domain S-box-containing protein